MTRTNASAIAALNAYWHGQFRGKTHRPLYFLVGQAFLDRFEQECLAMKGYFKTEPEAPRFRSGAMRCGGQGWWFKPVSLRTFKAAK